MKFPPVIRWILACVFLLAAGPARAQTRSAKTAVPDDDAATRLWLRELWVPSDALAPILGRYPRAVSLTHDQLFTLLRDAQAVDPAAPDAANPPPARAVLRQARFDGTLVLGPDARPQVRVEASLEVEALSDAWAEVPLGLPGVALGTAEIDPTASSPSALARASLRRSGGPGGSASLQLQGRGLHSLRLGFVLPVATGAAGSSIDLPTVESAGEFTLHLPAGTRADGSRGCAVQPESAGVVALVALGHAAGGAVPPLANLIRGFVGNAQLDAPKKPSTAPDRLNWRTPPPAAAETGAMLQVSRVDATAQESRVTVQQEIFLRAALGKLPTEVRLALPAGARAIEVEPMTGTLGAWDVGADGLRVVLAPISDGDDGSASFRVDYDLPLVLNPQGITVRVDVPLLEVTGTHRVTGWAAVWRGDGVQVRRIEPGAMATSAPGRTLARGNEESAPNFVAGFALADLPVAGGNAAPPVALMLEARRATVRFSVDADARADFQLDGVHLTRSLTFQVEEGELFSARVTLPAGETPLSVGPTGNHSEFDWRQQGDDLLLNWKTNVTDQTKTILITSRADFTAPKPGAPTDFAFGAALVPGAERLAGYVAVTGAPTLRLVTTGGEDRLERRDGRTTPMQGDVAWFYRDDFRLALRAEWRAAESEARFTGYALPLAGAVEIHAQLDYHFLYSGVETVKVRVPRALADAFFFTGEHVAERRLDDDVWTIRFQGEQRGDYTLGIQTTIPAPADPDDAQRFHFRLPVIVPLETARWSGAWAVEANTDTEIRFAAAGVNEVDALHAPPLAGYRPRRRVIGAFEFLGGAAAAQIDLDGVRHPAAGVAAAVVDRLELETFASTSGVSRHRATVRARTAGDGFFGVRLPPGATLWSLTLDGEPVKPVGGMGAPGDVRVELPGGRKPAEASTVVAIYETPGRPWTGAGGRSLAAPTFDAGVPVLQSRWTLHLPDGFDYRLPGSLLGADQPAAAPGDLLIPRMTKALGRLAGGLLTAPFPVYNSIQRRGVASMQARRRREAGEAQTVIDLPEDREMVVPIGTPDAKLAEATPLPAEPPGSDAQDASKASPKFLAPVPKLKELLTEAQNFYESARYDLAFKRYEQVLAIDPYNDEARKGEERVGLARTKHLETNGYPQLRGHQIWETTHDRELSAVTAMNRKLQRIIIPHIEFRSTTISDAIEYLRQESARLDTDGPPEQRGVNIFLKLPGVPSAQTAAPTVAPEPAIPGLPANPEAGATSGVVTGNTRINLSLSHIPLLEALRYVAVQAGLKVRVEQYAVSLVPLTENTDALITREFSISPNFTSNTSSDGLGKSALDEVATTAGGGGGGGATDNTGAGTARINRQDAKSFLESSGVQFPPGASATYLPSTGKLVMRNTQENIDLMESLSQQAGAGHAEPPSALDGRENAGGIVGLLPLQLDLPMNGRAYAFTGGGTPGVLEFHYTDWATAARWQWVNLTLGALGFLLFAAGWAHPWRRTLYATLALTFFPLIAAPAATVPCNALLAGWLWAVVGWCVTRLLLPRRRLVPVMLLCAATLLPRPADAAPGLALPSPVPGPSPEMVIVPYDATRPAAAQEPVRYYLPYERFLLLWDAAKRHRQPPPPVPPPGAEHYTLSAARYDARLRGDTLEIDAALDLQTFGEGWVGVPLGFEQNRVGAVTLDGAPAALAADGVLWVGTPGTHRVSVTLRLPAGNVATGSRLVWTVPPTTATLVTLLVPRADLRGEIRGNTAGGGEVEEVTPEGRRLTASIGGTQTVELTFHDAPAPLPASAQPALARVDARLSASARQESVHAEINLSFPGSAQDHFSVLLDRSLTLTGLDAPGVRQWHLATSGDQQTLEIALNAPARDGYQLTLTADRPIAALPAERRAFPVVSVQAARVELTAALLSEGMVEISLPDGPPANARRVEGRPPDEGRLFAAFASDGTTSIIYSLRAAAERRTAHIDYLYQVGHGKIELAASLRLAPEVGGASLLAVDLRLPAGFTVQAVAGEAVKQWWREGDVLSLRFRPMVNRSEVPLLVYLVRQFDRAPERFALQPLVAAGFTETNGETVVAADRSFNVGLTLPAGTRANELSEIDAATAAGEFQVKPPLERQRAFRYQRADFEVTATLESQPARWRAQWVTQAAVHEGAVAWETHFDVEALQGALDVLEFSLPPGVAEARVSGSDVRDTIVSGGGAARRTYRVLFQNPFSAGVEAGFTVSLELPLAPDGRAALPDLTLPGNNGQPSGGFLLVENASSGEMAFDPHGLDPAIEKDVPFLPLELAAGTRFFRAVPGVPWSLGLRVTSLEKTAGREALVAYAELTSTLRADGEEWHRASYRLQNRRLQFLPVELPAGMEFIGARVAGESVRVDAGPGGQSTTPRLLIPLLKTRPGELSYDVELIYHRPAPGPGGRQREPWFPRWQMNDPHLPGVPVEKTLWNVYVPEDARLLDIRGNVEPVVEALTTTEKLESELSDLSSLSATYRSSSASQEERQRALSNYHSLADEVTRTAKVVTPAQFEKTGKGTLITRPNAVNQNAMASQKQQAILNTVDSLNTANRYVAQSQAQAGGGALNQENRNEVGSILYGAPIGGKAPVLGDLPVVGRLWRDNRAPELKKEAARTLDEKAAFAGQIAPGTEQLALNDSVTVNLGGKEDASSQVSFMSSKQALPDQASKRLSSARAANDDERRQSVTSATGSVHRGPVPAAPPLPTAANAFSALSATALVPRDAAAAAAPAPPAETEARTDSLHSEGRISLAVDFPLEGQVYHFKKLKADAHFTLWTVQPSRLARLGWLGILLAGWALAWTLRWRGTRRGMAAA